MLSRLGEPVFEQLVARFEGQRGLQVAHGAGELLAGDVLRRQIGKLPALGSPALARLSLPPAADGFGIRQSNSDTAAMTALMIVRLAPARISQHGIGFRDALGDLLDGRANLRIVVSIAVGMERSRRCVVAALDFGW